MWGDVDIPNINWGWSQGFNATMSWCNNQVVLYTASDLVFHEQSKCNENDYHFICEKIQQNLVSAGYVKSDEQFGDIFTNALNGTWVNYLCNWTWSIFML